MKKTLTVLTALFAMSIGFSACGGDDPLAKDVTSVTLNKTTLILYEGYSETLTATLLPADADNKTLTWTSSDNTIATVSNGNVTAVKEGTATITAKSHNHKTATCAVTVRANTGAVTSVNLNKTATTLVVGAKETLTASVLPPDAANKNVSWSSNNEPVAIVSQSGEITAMAVGTATIIVTTEDGAKTATCAITVVAATVPVTGVSLNKSALELVIGNGELLTATVAPTNATNKTVTWTTSNAAVATVSAGYVTAVAAGSATITVTTTDGNFTATCEVTVPTPASTIGKVSINNGAETDFETGSLSALLTGTVTKIVFGNNASINGTDVKAMMALKTTLKHLDMTKVTVVPGGEAYIYTNITTMYVIGWGMFQDMQELETVLLPSNTITIDAYAFDACVKLTSYNIPEGVTNISESIFRGTFGESVTLPASLTNNFTYNAGALGYLNNIYVASGNTSYKSVAGVMYSSDEKRLKALPRNRTTYTVPEGVTILDSDCMNGAEINSVLLPASLSTIGSVAISGTKLVELTLPANVSILASYAIVNNNYLQTIIVNAVTPPTLASTESIRSNNSLTAIYVPDVSLAAYKATNGWSTHAAIIKPMSEKP